MVRHAIFSFLVAVTVTAILLFLPAGTLAYPQAWVFMAFFFVPMALIAVYLFRYSPELFRRRLDVKEKTPEQAALAKLFYMTICAIFIISGLDRRYGWSSVPAAVVIIAAAVFSAGYAFLFLVFRENKYLAHTVVVTPDQQVVTTGPYAVVRHPMYLSELVMFVSAPLVLGSYWGIVPDALLIAILAVRIITEERVLLEGLKGYDGYVKKTRYRLIPFVW
jgi:protein-S-isoprenylcysteine O-methyltransferase Ste14